MGIMISQEMDLIDTFLFRLEWFLRGSPFRRTTLRVAQPGKVERSYADVELDSLVALQFEV
jgi:hypothetical protein